MTKANAFYAQSGGVTAVINATACGVLQTGEHKDVIGKVLVGANGMLVRSMKILLIRPKKQTFDRWFASTRAVPLVPVVTNSNG